MITKYELPEEADFNLLSNFGEEVEMKTFKTNVPPTLECDKDQVLKIKILCLGDYTGGVGRKGVFINDYLQVTPPVPTNQYPVLGCDFYLKTTKWKKRGRSRSSYHHNTILGDWRTRALLYTHDKCL